MSGVDYKKLYENLGRRISALHKYVTNVDPGNRKPSMMSTESYFRMQRISSDLRQIAFGQLHPEDIRKYDAL